MYECDCSCEYGDGEPYDHYEAKNIVARVEHTCLECRDVIKPGEKCERIKTLDEDGWFTGYTCQICLRIRSDFCGGCFFHGTLWYNLHESNGIPYPWDSDDGSID